MNVCRASAFVCVSLCFIVVYFTDTICAYSRALALSLPLHVQMNFYSFFLSFGVGYFRNIFSVCDNELTDKLKQQQTIQSLYLYKYRQILDVMMH